MFDGSTFARSVKKNVLGQYVKALDKLDPEVARHILESNRQFFLAGKTFFESEVGHAEKAIARMEKKMAQDEVTEEKESEESDSVENKKS